MITRIALMAPTYKRAGTSLPVFMRSVIETADDPTRLSFFLCVNEGDTGTIEFLKSARTETEPLGVGLFIVSENLICPDLSYYFNALYEVVERYMGDPCAVSMLGDDMEFLTQGWDTKILDALNKRDGNAIVYADDAYIAHEKLCVNMFTSIPFVRATGLPFMCPAFKADMIDVVWYRVGKLTGTLVYLRDVKIKHNHNTAKPESEHDETFTRLRPAQSNASDRPGRLAAEQYAHAAAGALIRAGRAVWAL